MKYAEQYLKHCYQEIKEHCDGEAVGEDGEIRTIWDCVGGQLDYCKIYNSTGELAGVKIMIALGGPTVWIDTEDQRLYFVHGNEIGQMWVYSDMCDAINEVFYE